MPILIEPQKVSEHSLLKEVESRLREITKKQNGLPDEIATHVIEAGGKRLRPLLVILSAREMGGHLLDLATAVELIHTASLIHDDVLDKAATRRGRPSSNLLWGNHASVLTGDYLFAKAFGLLARLDNPKILELLVEAIGIMCEGQIEETKSLFNTKATENDYLQRIYKKTAFFLGACCKSGAIAGNSSPEATASLESFGSNLGCGFQIIDDLLDFTADEDTLGKPVMADLTQGILTLPAIHLLNNPEYGEHFLQIIQAKDFASENLSLIKLTLYETEAFAYATEKAEDYLWKAAHSLDLLPDNYQKRALMELIALLSAKISKNFQRTQKTTDFMHSYSIPAAGIQE